MILDSHLSLTEYCMQSSWLEESNPFEHRDDLKLAKLLLAIGSIIRNVSALVERAGVSRLFGAHGTVNIQGEDQQKLDVISNQMFVDKLKSSGVVEYIISEEMEDVVHVDSGKEGSFIVCFDPLDGSNNIDCLAPVGSIFAIYSGKSVEKKRDQGSISEGWRDVITSGRGIVAAGYALYGSATMLVLSIADDSMKRVNGFVLDPLLGEFKLSQPNIRMGMIVRGRDQYSTNESYSPYWDERITKFIQSKKEGSHPKAQRYIGSFIADFHRTLMYGGIFLYPSNSRESPSGKLRLLYECYPAAFIAEQGGGCAVDGRGEQILDISPHTLHDRCPLFVGTRSEIDTLNQFLNEYN